MKIFNDPDKKTLELWSQYEHHPNQPRPISFWFYFPHKKGAELAKGVLEKDGFDVDISPAASSNNQWLCLAYKTMVPEYAELSDLRNWLENIAEELRGNYDGWEIEIIQ